METVLVAVLAPFLSHLLKGSEFAAEAFGRRAGEEGWILAKRVWDRLGPRIQSRPAAIESAADVAEHPDDQRAHGALELQLIKLLEADPRLAQEMQTLLDDASLREGGDVHFHDQVRAHHGGVVAGRVIGGIHTSWREDRG